MKKLIKEHKQSIILLTSIIIGGLIGLIFKEDTIILKPFGTLFLNLLLIIIVPLLFVSISSSITKVKKPKRLGKILCTTFIVFFITSLVCATITFLTIKNIDLVNPNEIAEISSLLDYSITTTDSEVNILESTVNLISTNDFINLLSTNNMIAVVLFAILFGLSINATGKKAEIFSNLLDTLNDIINNYIKIIMYYAPIGLGCYFAVLIGTFGSELAVGFLKTFIIYLVIALIIYFFVYSFFAYISAGKKGVKAFWKNIFPATITALGTCSSAASVPTNIMYTKKMGVSSEIAQTTVSLGTSFHKDGSTIGSVFKIIFLLCLFGESITISNSIQILGIALLATLTVSAIPIGGGTISEALIIALLGYPIAVLPILTVIATVIDAPATMLNVTGDSAAALIINRLVDGKKWVKEKFKK